MTARPLDLQRRKALLWVRKNQPAQWPRDGANGAPRHRYLVELLQDGYIHFDPERKRYDPIAYCLTDSGKRALELAPW